MSSSHNDAVVVCAVGDVMINRDDPKSIFELAKPVLDSGDFVWGNSETAYAESGTPSLFMGPVADAFMRNDPKNIEALTWAGFNVMGVANNRILENGHAAFLETIDRLRASGIATAGGGKNIVEARTPTVVEHNGTKVAFLAYAPVTWPTFEATQGRPGVASLKIHTFYEVPTVNVPHHGKPPFIHTFVDPTHLASFEEDIREAKQQADVVMVGFHWGIHFESGEEGYSPLLLADYEFELAHAAIDAGADVILGGGQHVLKAVEVYNGKVIFHGLGNFAQDLPDADGVLGGAMKTWDTLGKYGTPFGRGRGAAGFAASLVGAGNGAFGEAKSAFLPEPGSNADYPSYPFHPMCRRNMIVKITIADKAVEKVSIVPCLVNTEGQPQPLAPGDDAFETVASFIEQITADVNIHTKFSIEDGEIVVNA